jgi:predicted transposase YdaD
MAFSAAFLALEQATKLEQSKTIALRMLGKQLDLETIAEVTGLTIEQIKQLQSQAATN